MRKTYSGVQTALAHENFPFPLPIVSLSLIKAITQIKKAAARTNAHIGVLDHKRKKAIVQACDEILSGLHDNEFTLPFLQGGAGTSINMNVNEVIANRASELLRVKKSKLRVHPNDHVNLFQSTNDVNPSALRIALLQLYEPLINALEKVESAFEKKATQSTHILKLGRTHLQDAVPITFAQEFRSYRATIAMHTAHIAYVKSYLYSLNLGGTAVGNGVTVPKAYTQTMYSLLSKQVGFPLVPAPNMMSLTSSGADFVHISGALHALCIDLSKIATDLRFLASGPQGGIGEIRMPNLQKGSSIMPGKINPVIAESVNQLYFFVSGNHTSLCLAAENSHLELSVMFPIIAHSMLSSISTTTAVLTAFAKHCIDEIIIDEEKTAALLEKSSAYATLFTPLLGYDVMSHCVKESIDTKTSLKTILLEKHYITLEQFDQIIADYVGAQ